MNPYFHVRKEDIHAGSAIDVNPPFASFDVVLRRDYDAVVQAFAAYRSALLSGEPESDQLRALADHIQSSHSQARPE